MSMLKTCQLPGDKSVEKPANEKLYSTLPRF